MLPPKNIIISISFSKEHDHGYIYCKPLEDQVVFHFCVSSIGGSCSWSVGSLKGLLILLRRKDSHMAGLGYYRDLRQPRQRPRPRPPPQEVLDLPLVEEVVIVPAPLPEYARDFMETSSALTTRLPADEVEVEQEEPELLHQLGRQNLLLRIPLPHQSFADLRLSAVGRRLTISFCTRSASASTASTASRWRRRSLRRTLGGQVDLQQSYADVIGSKETSELQVGEGQSFFD